MLSKPVKLALSGLSGETTTSFPTSGSGLNGAAANIIEKMLLKLICMMESWQRESREYQARMERIMRDRIRGSHESNRLQKVKIELERETFEFMKLRRTIEEMRSSQVVAAGSTGASVNEIDENPLSETDPDDIPIIESVESA